MKKIILTFFVFTFLLQSCSTEAPIEGSDLDTSTPTLTSLDKYLRSNYTTPYNIEVSYAWNDSEVDFNRYLFPPSLDKVQPAMDAVKKIWLDSYKAIAGPDFVKLIAPRKIVLIGGLNVNPSGTITLGFAEGGKKIVFFNVDLLDLKDRGSLTRFVSTIQHEYCHIINQTVPFKEQDYREITPNDYTAQWFNSSISEARELGYITDYARANPFEDFAEMVNTMLSFNNADYNAIINAISSDTAKANIRTKEAFVVDYFKSEFDIDFYELQRVAAENIEKVLN